MGDRSAAPDRRLAFAEPKPVATARCLFQTASYRLDGSHTFLRRNRQRCGKGQ